MHTDDLINLHTSDDIISDDEEDMQSILSFPSIEESDIEEPDEIRIILEESINRTRINEIHDVRWQVEKDTDSHTNTSNVSNGLSVVYPVTLEGHEDAVDAFNKYQKHLSEGIEINLYEQCQLHLYELLRVSNAPKGLYEKVIKWENSHCNITKDGKLK